MDHTPDTSGSAESQAAAAATAAAAQVATAWDVHSTRRAVLRLQRSSMKMDAKTSGLLSGRVSSDDIPSEEPRIVRIFLCSTATDSCTERTVFLERVYPKLREYCRHRYGLEFQMVDLAWGMPEVQQRCTDLRSMKMQEILKCQNLSAGPNFVAFIGQKYGPLPLPTSIPAEEYEVIRVALHAHRGRETRNADRLDHTYVIDTNSVPPVYVMRNVSDIIRDVNQDNLLRREPADMQWSQLQPELCVFLQKGAELAYLDGVLDSDVRSRFYMSDLEKQIHLGLDNCDNPHNRCALILRDIVDLKNYVGDARAPAFTDLTASENSESGVETDGEAESRLLRLKNRARGLISPANTISHEVLWRYDNVISPELHQDYLEKLCSELYDVVVRLVDQSAGHMLEKPAVHPLAYEAMQHWTRCKRLTEDSLHCQNQMDVLRNYITQFSDKPLVVYGPSGSGTTTIVSKLALELLELVPTDLLSMIRYVGFTPKSADIRQLLLGVCTQLAAALGHAARDVPIEYNDLQRFFHELLAAIPPDTTVVLIMDSLEQLLPDYNAHLLSWLPKELPSHIKIVLTVKPAVHGLLPRLRNEHLKGSPSSFVEMQALSLPDSLDLLTHFLASSNRKISEAQMLTMTDKLLTYSLPLYVKLLAQEALKLKSFSSPACLDLPDTLDDGINQFFDRLEADHGQPLVSRAMAYMVASKTGVSDLEMEDLLSLDDVVLNHIFRDEHATRRRVPFASWLMIRRDAEPFLFPQEADGVVVTVWKHECFVQAIRRRYLSDAAEVLAVHSLLADYFLGTWSDLMKPIMLPTGIPFFPPCGSQASRLVPRQPLTFPAYKGDTEVKFNKRMYDQVPRHLQLSGRQVELNTLVLFNYEWLYSKMKALSLQHILADFALNPSEQATLVQEALRGAAPVIEKDINNLSAELSGRLLPYFSAHASIRALIRSCDRDGLKQCALLPNFPYQQVPGSSLQFTLECPRAPHFLGLVFQERFLLSKKRDSPEVHVFDMLTGELKDVIMTSNGELHVTPDGRHFAIVDHLTEKSVKIHASSSGEFLGQIILLKHVKVQGDKYRAGPLCLTDDRLAAVVETSDTSILFISEVPTCTMLQIISLDGKATVCQISPDGKHVLCNSNEFLLIYDLYTAQHLCTVPVVHKPSAMAFAADGLRVYLVTPQDSHMLVMHLNQGKVDMTYRQSLSSSAEDSSVSQADMQGDVIRELTVAPNDRYVLIRSDQHLVVHARSLEKVIAHFFRPEQVPKEFRLPKSNFEDLVFTKAHFTRDSENVIATIFRTIYTWNVYNKQLLTTIQAPIGIITSLLVCKERGQLVTHAAGSRSIHVWNVASKVAPNTRRGQAPDKLSAAMQQVLMTKDNAIAFVQCANSDEVGVIDMRTGVMLDLLTHDSKVQDMAITPTGHMALVTTKPRLSGTACKLWDLTERRVIKEWGDHGGLCLSLHDANSVVLLSQPRAHFDCPYDISIIHFIGDTHSVHQHPAAVKYVRARPVATADDRFIVLSSALGYEERTASHVSPCLVVFDMTAAMRRTCYDAKSVGLEGVMEDVLSVQACPHLPSSVVVIVSCRPIGPVDDEEDFVGVEQGGGGGGGSGPSGGTKSAVPIEDDLQIGFFILDVRLGKISAQSFLQPAPETPFPPSLVFSRDFSLCMDEASCLYDLANHTAHSAHIPETSRPQCLALNGSAAVYFRESLLLVYRLRDAALMARCQVHAPVCHVALAADQRTLLVGCGDGTLASYVLVDPLSLEDDLANVLPLIRSRRMSLDAQETDGRLSRTWDKVETAGSAPAYSRPPSALSLGSRDKLILRQIKPVTRFRPKSDTMLYLNTKSQACALM